MQCVIVGHGSARQGSVSVGTKMACSDYSSGQPARFSCLDQREGRERDCAGSRVLSGRGAWSLCRLFGRRAGRWEWCTEGQAMRRDRSTSWTGSLAAQRAKRFERRRDRFDVT